LSICLQEPFLIGVQALYEIVSNKTCSTSVVGIKMTSAADIVIRPARPEDAPSMVSLLNAIIAKGGTTAYSEPFTVQKMLDLFVDIDISCVVAVQQAEISTSNSPVVVGFQGLEWSDPDWPGEDKLPADWAMIATFVALEHQGQGIGRSLFQATLQAAKAAGVFKMDATIRSYNKGAQVYYTKMGFQDYKTTDETISKRFDLT
jgi:RimJ/RimL family protein N-acetyltransferase